MIVQLCPDDVAEWFLVFHLRCDNPFWNRWLPGHFKHVRAFAFSHGARCWIFYDVSWQGTKIVLAPGESADALIGQYVNDSSVLKIGRQPGPRVTLPRLGFWCVPAMRHLLNLPGGALLPDGLWRDCIEADAKVVIDASPETGPARPRRPATAGAGDG